jgi:hypothetical protein
MRNTLIVIFLSALLLAGCASAANTSVATETSAPKSNLATPVKPTETKTATPTINLATEVESTSVEKNEITTTITPSPTEGPSVARGPIRTCQGNGEVLPISDDFTIKGTIIYQLIENYSGLYAFGGDPGQQSQLPVDQKEYYRVLGFSPDGKWLAYIPIPLGAFDQLWTREFVWEYFDLVLLSDTGEKIEHRMDITQFTLGLSKDEYSQQGPAENIWINDHLIYTNLTVIAKEKTEFYGYFLPNPAVFDPFTGTWHQELIEALPDDDISKIAFSSDMQRAVYFKAPDRLVLWNLMENEAIWEYQKSIRSVSSIEIKWAPDDSIVLIANQNKEKPMDFEIILLSRDGKVEQKIASWNYPAPSFYPIYIEWSPNSKYVSLSNTTLYEFEDEVYIYDVNSKGYLYRCPFNNPGNMIWSPDSRYLAMGEGYESLRILDIEKEEILELVPYGIPVGWSETFPTDWP